MQFSVVFLFVLLNVVLIDAQKSSPECMQEVGVDFDELILVRMNLHEWLTTNYISEDDKPHYLNKMIEYLFCVNKERQLQDTQGTFLIDEVVNTLATDEEKKVQMRELMTKCFHEDDDALQVTYLTIKCVYNKQPNLWTSTVTESVHEPDAI